MKRVYVIPFAIFFIIFLAGGVDSYNHAYLIEHDMALLNRDIFFKTLGEFKNSLSDMSYLKADIYYHGGVYHIDEGEDHSHGTLMDEREHALLGEETEEREETAQKPGPSLNILLDAGKAVAITGHRHLTGTREKEIVPWLYYAVKLNPHNETAYAVGGFWLATNLKKTDEAIKFLREGLAQNPRSWQISQMLGLIYLVKLKDYENAKIYLEKAKECGDRQDLDKFDTRSIYTPLANVYAKTGQTNKALRLYKKLLILFPANKTIEGQIREIESGSL